MKKFFNLIFVSLAVLVSLSAQTTKIVPAYASLGEGNGLSAFPFGYHAGRMQQVLVGDELCNSTAMITSLSLRADPNTVTNLPGTTYSNLKFSLGYTSMTPITLSSTFAANRTGLQTTVFSGQFNLPKQGGQVWPFNIILPMPKPFLYIRQNGNLLLEIEIPGQIKKSNYLVDGHNRQKTAGGSEFQYGTQGAFSGRDILKPFNPNLTNLKAGGRAEYFIQGMAKQYTAMVVWGFSRTNLGPLPLPFDLTFMGAPGNHIYASLDITATLPINPGRNGWEGRSYMTIPNYSFLAGVSLFVQSLFLHGASNNAGLVTSQGLSMTIGGKPATMRMVTNNDSTALTGTVDWNEESGLVMALKGTFN